MWAIKENLNNLKIIDSFISRIRNINHINRLSIFLKLLILFHIPWSVIGDLKFLMYWRDGENRLAFEMTKRIGGFDQKNNKKIKLEEDIEALWGDDLDADAIEDCFNLATQVCQQVRLCEINNFLYIHKHF